MKYLIYVLIVLALITNPLSMVSADKPNIDKDKELTKAEQKQVKDYLKGKIFKELTPAKNDYKDKFDRGTVHFNPKKGINILGEEVFRAANYCFQKVIIADGTTIHDVNFYQREPHTKAIKGDNLTFVNCTLTNNAIDPTWTIINCANSQVKDDIVLEEGKYWRRRFVEKDGKFIEIERTRLAPEDALERIASGDLSLTE